MKPILDVQGISLSFGGLKAVSGFNLELKRGELHGLIGPNGAGKTTVFNILTGVHPPDCGTIHLEDRLLNGLRPYQIAQAGIGRTFQNIRLFGNLSVLDNVQVACHLRERNRLTSAILLTARQLQEEHAITLQARKLLEIFNLLPRQNDPAGSLPYGDQRRLEIARALATEPKVLLLDEPAAGMNPQETRALGELIRFVRKTFHLTVLLIEHHMGLVMEICEGITVLDHGEIIAVGTPAHVQNNPKVIEAYLGKAPTAPQTRASQTQTQISAIESSPIQVHPTQPPPTQK